MKFILYFWIASIVLFGWYVLVTYMRDMNKRMKKAETMLDNEHRRMNMKADMDDKHIIALAMNITDLEERIEFAEKVIGYSFQKADEDSHEIQNKSIQE